jgi:hypothetical protein
MQFIKTALLISMIADRLYPDARAAFPLLKLVTAQFPPYYYTAAGKAEGISTVVVLETLKRAGVKYRLQFYPAIHEGTYG